MTRHTRRGVLAGGIAILVAGCADTGDGGPEDTDATPTPDGQTSASPTSTEPPHGTPVVEPETIIDETYYTDQRIPVEATAGTSWEITATVQRGGPAIVAVSSVEGQDALVSTKVYTEDTVTVETPYDGAHYLQFGVVDGEVDVTVVERRG